MVRSSTASCFKLITCAGGADNDAVDRDDLGPPQSKGSSDRSKWSFRKRSARHRVLNNSATPETPNGDKACPDSAAVNFQSQASSTIGEKNTVIQRTEEKNKVQIPVDSKLSLSIVSAEDENRADSTPDEAVVIIIQSAMRRFLAQRMLLKHKNIIKLQAAVRGHIVRRYAVGSLRCVLAIVKMQALVRERSARLKGLSIEQKLDETDKNDHRGSFMVNENPGIKPHTYTSIEKLLSNAFAQQLLESTPKTKTINIKCDPSKSDAAWQWLERWMSVSSVENGQSQKAGLATEQQDEHNIVERDFQLETVISSPENCQSTDTKTSIEALAVATEADDDVITYDADSYDFQECRPTLTSVGDKLEQSHPQNIGKANSSNSTLDFLLGHSGGSDCVTKMEPDSLHDQSDMGHEQLVDVLERTGSEVSEIHAKKSLFGSRKACNPAFIAAQSKFEELSSAANLGKSFSLSNQDASVDSSSGAVFPVINHAFGSRETGPGESYFNQTSGIQVGGSECGTELSISSTLDSPDRSEVEVVDFAKETKSLEDDGTENSKNSINLEVDEQVESVLLDRDLSFSNSSQPEIHESSTAANSEHVSSIVAVNSSNVEHTPDSTAAGVHGELESETSHPVSKSSPEASSRSHVIGPGSQGTPSSQVSLPVSKSSPEASPRSHVIAPGSQATPSQVSHPVSSSREASPRSHVIVPESQGTPSSQVSVKPKKIRSGKHVTNHKRGSVSTGKESHMQPNQDNGARSSSEHLSNEHKTGKRLNSFGSVKPDHGDQEPGDSSSGSSLPSYMQATESARAKALANSSPRSSPDVQDKELYIKKRRSLPGTNTRQGSPHVQRSLSQAQQGNKGNGTHSPQEKKWQR
ncbi:hypothetical protein ACH5RR_027459 [Cinchona calisaya]|uniref:DUF4005 domain-containing protein n=1 Tax=Cinchona calisaya TaxID=153742 RepID=A0ABD2Z9E7_9GENT